MTRESLLKSASDRVLDVINDPTFGNQWAQVRSKHLLMSISSEEVGAINYTYSGLALVSMGDLETARQHALAGLAEVEGLRDHYWMAGTQLSYYGSTIMNTVLRGHAYPQPTAYTVS